MTIPDASPHDSPVFVDASGRRRRVLRTVVGLASLAGLAYATLLCFALTDGPVEPPSLLPASHNENTTTTAPPPTVRTPPTTVQTTKHPTVPPTSRRHPAPTVTTAAGAPLLNIAPFLKIAPVPVPVPAPLPPPGAAPPVAATPSPAAKSGRQSVLPSGLIRRGTERAGDGG
ncbi:hypothetical protein [Allokutzneria albata]|uniref:Uncharacterized protein n=1 Tax=Allokutzneria albata TaxID=211114 RepID=A0A1G9R1N4_ALLAB|nr:hypothetical protein [Allokutzneria albata]SDM17148.1 hypothetical protein SAMN04489726_0151 [Allokutzneria albata]